MRTFAAVAMFLFGTTFLWMTESFAGRAEPPTGTVWTVTNIGALAAVLGFTIAAWGLYRDADWWGYVALVSAVVGLVVVVPFVLASRQAELPLADMGVQINIWMHVLGAAAVIALVRVPVLADWFDARLS